MDELQSSDIQGDQMEEESGVTRSIIDQLHSWDIQGYQVVVKVVLFELSLMNFFLRISKEMKWKVKVVLFEVSLINFILRISNDIKWKGKVV